MLAALILVAWRVRFSIFDFFPVILSPSLRAGMRRWNGVGRTHTYIGGVTHSTPE